MVKATLKEGNAASGISHCRTSAGRVNVLNLARGLGATTAVITKDSESPLPSQAGLVLRTGSQEKSVFGKFMGVRIGQPFIIDSLYSGVVFALGDRAQRDLEKTTKADEEVWNH